MTRLISKAGVTAAVLAIVMAINSFASAFGFNFIAAIGTWTGQAFEFMAGQRSQQGNYPRVAGELSDIALILDDLGIVIGLPMAIAEGFWFDKVDEIHRETPVTMMAWFTNGDSFFSLKVYEVTDLSSGVWVEANREDGWEPFLMRSVTYFLTENNARSAATWYDGAYKVTIQGQITREQILDMVRSIE
jgi:hypothetical protein